MYGQLRGVLPRTALRIGDKCLIIGGPTTWTPTDHKNGAPLPLFEWGGGMARALLLNLALWDCRI